MLWNPDLRSALYKLLAAVPRVTVNDSARDGIGRPAVEVRRADNSGLRGGKSDGVIYATYESSATGTVLESTVTYPPGSGIVTPRTLTATAQWSTRPCIWASPGQAPSPPTPYGG